MTKQVVNQENFRHSYPAHWKRLVATLARIVGPDEAEDLAQDTLVIAYSEIDTFRNEASIFTWLHRIALNLAYDRLRRKHEKTVDIDGEEGSDLADIHDGTPEDQCQQGEMSACVRGLVDQLPEHYQTVLVRADVLGYTAPEISKEIGVSMANVKIRLHRARQAMKVSIEENCHLHHRDAGILCCTPKTASKKSNP